MSKCARARFSVHRDGLEKCVCVRSVYACARGKEEPRRKTNGERGKKAYHPNARD